MKFSELVRGASLRGSPAVFTAATALRLGRAVGTLLRRRSDAPGRAPVVVGRAGEGPELIVRDGLCQGLVLSGFDVVDLGVCESDLFTFALRTRGEGGAASDGAATGGALVGTTGDSLGVMLFAGARPLVGEGLVELARIADKGAFCVGAGTLGSRDLRTAFLKNAGQSERDTEADA